MMHSLDIVRRYIYPNPSGSLPSHHDKAIASDSYEIGTAWIDSEFSYVGLRPPSVALVEYDGCPREGGFILHWKCHGEPRDVDCSALVVLSPRS